MPVVGEQVVGSSNLSYGMNMRYQSYSDKSTYHHRLDIPS